VRGVTIFSWKSVWLLSHIDIRFVQYVLELDKSNVLMNCFNSSFYQLNGSLNFVPSSPRLVARCEPVSFSFHFRRRVNFFGTFISHRSTHSLYRPTFIFSHRLFSWSWPSWISRSFVRVIRGSRAAICHAQIQEFAPPERGRPSEKGETHARLFLINAWRTRMPFHSCLAWILYNL